MTHGHKVIESPTRGRGRKGSPVIVAQRGSEICGETYREAGVGVSRKTRGELFGGLCGGLCGEPSGEAH